MKLRNKRTGKIVELEKILFKNAQTEDLLKWKTYEPNVNSIAELNEEWEDYKPAEPLIKDDKARKVFRGWADLLGAKCFRVEHFCKYGRTIITSTDLIPKPVIEIPGYIGEDLGTYTREELCGEEE